MFPSLPTPRSCQPQLILLWSESAREGGRDAPRDDPWEAGVRAGDDEEGAKVLGTDAHVRDVDREADEAEDEPCEDERVSFLDVVGPDCPAEQCCGCGLCSWPCVRVRVRV